MFVCVVPSQRASRSTVEECGIDFLSWFLASITVPPGSAEVQNLSADLKRGSYTEDPYLLHSH